MAESTHWCQGGMRKWDSSDGYVICPCCSKKWVCLCVSWIRDLHPKQNISKFHVNSKIGFWDCNQFMRLHMQTVLSNKQKPSKPWKLSFVNLCTLWNQDHQLTQQAIDRLPKPNPRACFQHAAGPLLSVESYKKQTVLPCESVSYHSYPWNTRQRW